jgi:hypothetical protein
MNINNKAMKLNIFMTHIDSRAARWYIFQPKIPIWVNFGGSCNGRCWYILWPFGMFYGILLYFTAIWYTLWPFGIFYGHWVYFHRFGMFVLISGNPDCQSSHQLISSVIHLFPPFISSAQDSVYETKLHQIPICFPQKKSFSFLFLSPEPFRTRIFHKRNNEQDRYGFFIFMPGA